eukprot:4647545-Alexandrium_andersonii.AAC.1
MARSHTRAARETRPGRGAFREELRARAASGLEGVGPRLAVEVLRGVGAQLAVDVLHDVGAQLDVLVDGGSGGDW